MVPGGGRDATINTCAVVEAAVGAVSVVALIGFRGGEVRNGKLGCEHLVREQRRE